MPAPLDNKIKEWWEKLTEDEQYLFEERAAIIEYDGEKDRMSAEVLAFEELAFYDK